MGLLPPLQTEPFGRTFQALDSEASENHGATKQAGSTPTYLSFGPDMTIQLPAFVNVLTRSGLGSQLMVMFLTSIYLKDTQRRDLIVDESIYAYSYNETTGFLRGFFTPHFPVIEFPKQYAILQPYLPTGYNYSHAMQEGRVSVSDQGTDTAETSIIAVTSYDYRHKARKYFGLRHDNFSSLKIFETMIQTLCPHMQFNEHALRRMAEFRRANGIEPMDDSRLPSVAFHVRRGDKTGFVPPRNNNRTKVRKLPESMVYYGDVYVQKLLSVTPPNTTFGDCFVASDSFDAVQEIRDALERYNVRCRFQTLTKKSERGSRGNHMGGEDPSVATLAFLSEMELLIRATFFVGTFNSNVGAMVTVLRGCGDVRSSSASHYFDSYGVDQDRWYLL
jgi:hypothetical protein